MNANHIKKLAVGFGIFFACFIVAQLVNTKFGIVDRFRGILPAQLK